LPLSGNTCFPTAATDIENFAANYSKNVRKTMPQCTTIRKHCNKGFPPMLVGYMRVSSESDRQTTDLQRDALQAAGVDSRHLLKTTHWVQSMTFWQGLTGNNALI
jgi:hypothetical protein